MSVAACTLSPMSDNSAGGNPAVSIISVVIDTPDPGGLAKFYADLLGWGEPSVDSDWADIKGPDGSTLNFQLAPDLTPPSWPDPRVPQQFHLDFRVDDLDAAEKHAIALGARPVEGPDHSPTFRVYLDPTGHPFCLCR